MTVEVKNTKGNLKIKNVEKQVKQLLNDQLPANLFFHDLNHTIKVKEAAIQLGKAEKLNKSDREILTLAALFHDTGFIKTYQEHEGESQLIAATYLREQNYPEDKIEKVKSLIKITDPKIAPASLLEKIMCDADTAYVGQKKYRSQSNNLRKEWELNKKDYYPLHNLNQ